MHSIKLSDSLINSESSEGVKFLDCIQGNILKSHGREESIHIFLKVNDSEKCKKWISNFSKKYVTSAFKQQNQTKRWKNDNHHSIFCNMMFSSSAYNSLHLSHYKPNDIIWNKGMKYQGFLPIYLAKILGFRIPLYLPNPLSDPPISSWEDPFQNDIDICILLASCKEIKDKLNELSKSIIDNANENGFIHIHTEDGHVIKNNNQVIEHFGHPDGISQPLFLQCDYDKYLENQQITNPSDMAKYNDPKAPLNLVLIKDPLGNNKYDFGSYMVYRKLQQDVKAYELQVQNLANKLQVDYNIADQMVIGRDINGKPMAILKTDPLEGIVPDNFDFSINPKKKSNICPFQSHIRKVNTFIYNLYNMIYFKINTIV